MRNLRLEVVDSAPLLADFTMGALTGELPGFQIDPSSMSRDTILEVVTGTCSLLIPNFNLTPFQGTSVSDKAMDNGDSPPHFDSSTTIGVAVHENEGEGLVKIGDFTLEEYELYRKLVVDEKFKREEIWKYFKRNIHMARLGSGITYTVFRENMIPINDIPPVLHEFITRRNTVRAWTSYRKNDEIAKFESLFTSK